MQITKLPWVYFTLNSSASICSASICTVSADYEPLISQLKFYNCTIITTLAPFLIMTVANTFTTCKLVRSKRHVLGKTKGSMKKEIKFGATMISLNLLFCIFFLPFCIFMILNKVFKNEFYNTALFVMLFFRNIHSCLGFFIYLCVNSIFRSEFIGFVRKLFRIDSIKILKHDISTVKGISRQTKVTRT